MKSLFARGISRVARFVVAPIVRRRAERRHRICEMHRVARAIQQVNARVAARRAYYLNHYDADAEVLDGAIMKLVPIVANSTPLVEAIEDGMAEEHSDHRRRGIRLHAPDEHTPPATERPRVCEEEAADAERWDGLS